MYDTVIFNGDEFQTKQFNCKLDTLHITTRLLRVPLEEELYDAEDMNFHGEMNFYRDNPQTRRWEEWTARFVNGNFIAARKDKKL